MLISCVPVLLFLQMDLGVGAVPVVGEVLQILEQLGPTGREPDQDEESDE